ncbi:MAG: type II toxin-antitoxin system VapC family toxin [bacterium]|nr:type II toxin-antitoxin system VapC family toxin [bacterium]
MILLDTHVLVWQERGDRRLGPKSRRLLEGAVKEGGAAVSAISFWEVGIRIRKGGLDLQIDLGVWRRDLLDEGLIEVPVDGAIAARAGLLPELHGDLADRLIVATALEGHRLMTADRLVLDWPGPINRINATE